MPNRSIDTHVLSPDIGMFLMSKTLPVKGVTLVGLLPPELQSYVIYAGAVVADSAWPEPALALAFVKVLSNPAKREHWKGLASNRSAASNRRHVRGERIPHL